VAEQRLLGGALADPLAPDEIVGRLQSQRGKRRGNHPIQRQRHDIVADEPEARGGESPVPHGTDERP